MLDKLETMRQRHEALSEEIGKAEVIANQERWRSLVKEHAELDEIMTVYAQYRETAQQIRECKEILAAGDPELAELAKDELPELEDGLEQLTVQLKQLLLPKDPNDEKNVILEIRAGTGGEEAALFGMDLLRMYQRFAERAGFKTEYLSTNFTELGGVKEVVLNVMGRGAYSQLKFESGVHRVQRVPETESGGRIHTSAATVAVMPEAEDVDVQISPADLRIDVYRASGHGGQCVNTTDSAVRITHLPTGLVVTCQDEKSQLKNKEKCLKVLKSRLLEQAQAQAEAEYAQARKSQVGSGDRSERVRTYNFPQGRVTDHRIGLTLYKLDAFLDGDMQEMIEALQLDERERNLRASE